MRLSSYLCVLNKGLKHFQKDKDKHLENEAILLDKFGCKLLKIPAQLKPNFVTQILQSAKDQDACIKEGDPGLIL
jgi:hypothetical protein